mmetsp:Transcript_7907/g.16964  ORF Transcript_7907/g.16964 Transcript_7907/m.16964 type:complete len:245 (+) Transcript_7907:516-1250(+)
MRAPRSTAHLHTYIYAYLYICIRYMHENMEACVQPASTASSKLRLMPRQLPVRRVKQALQAGCSAVRPSHDHSPLHPVAPPLCCIGGVGLPVQVLDTGPGTLLRRQVDVVPAARLAGTGVLAARWSVPGCSAVDARGLLPAAPLLSCPHVKTFLVHAVPARLARVDLVSGGPSGRQGLVADGAVSIRQVTLVGVRCRGCSGSSGLGRGAATCQLAVPLPRPLIGHHRLVRHVAAHAGQDLVSLC